MMRKKILAVIAATAIIATTFVASVYAATDIKLFINGKLVNADLQIVDGSSYVPLRVVSETLGADIKWDDATRTITITSKDHLAYDATLTFPSSRYPETAAHISAALAKGESAICTIDRNGADENREESLKGIPTKPEYDRDEWPMAMCAEGGEGADIAYVAFSDNRGSGSWVGNQFEAYTDGTRILFVLEGGISGEITPIPTPTVSPATTPSANVVYANCTAVKAAGKAPIRIGDPA